LLGLAVAASLGAHVAVAGLLWVRHPPQPKAGAVVAVQIVSQAGQRVAARRPSPSQAARAGRAHAAEALERPPPVPVPPEAKTPAAPRGAAAVAAVPQPPQPSPLAPAPIVAADALKPKPLRRARSASAAALAAPHPVAARGRTRARAQARHAAAAPTPARGRTPIIAADADSAAPGAGPPGAGPAGAGPAGAAGSSPPRYGLGSAANPIPDYPDIARDRGWEGLVVLSVAVASDGRAESVSVARSTGHDVLDRAARDAVRRWRFEPARRAGMPVAATVEVPIRFRLD
jgi:protein TonB